MNRKQNSNKALGRKLVEMRRQEFKDFAKFRRYYFKKNHALPDAPFHGEIAAALGEMRLRRGARLALAAPRGSAKSTLIALEYVIYCICRHAEEYIVLVGHTADRAEEALQNVKREMETNELLLQDYPEVCRFKPAPRRWSQREIIAKNGVRVLALGLGQSIRGTRHGAHRPTLVILDDVEGNELVQNEDSRYKNVDWLEKSILKAGDKLTNFILTGTIHHYGSLLAQYTDPALAPGWDARVYRSVIDWSPAAKLWDEWSSIFCGRTAYNSQTGPSAALAFFTDRRAAMLEGTKVLWPDNWDYHRLMVMREQEGPSSFGSEMQNEPYNLRDCIFKIEDLHFWDDKFRDEEALLKSIPHLMIDMACDPSLGKDTTRGDFSAILTGAWDYATKTLYVLDAHLERCTPDQLIEKIVSYYASRHAHKLAFEANNFQQILLDDLLKRGRERGVAISSEPVKNTRDKVLRIHALQPCLKTGQIQLRRAHRTLIDQLKYFPKGLHDDGPDALEMLYQIASDHVDFAAVGRGLERLVEGMRQWHMMRQDMPPHWP